MAVINFKDWLHSQGVDTNRFYVAYTEYRNKYIRSKLDSFNPDKLVVEAFTWSTENKYLESIGKSTINFGNLHESWIRIVHKHSSIVFGFSDAIDISNAIYEDIK